MADDTETGKRKQGTEAEAKSQETSPPKGPAEYLYGSEHDRALFGAVVDLLGAEKVKGAIVRLPDSLTVEELMRGHEARTLGEVDSRQERVEELVEREPDGLLGVYSLLLLGDKSEEWETPDEFSGALSAARKTVNRLMDEEVAGKKSPEVEGAPARHDSRDDPIALAATNAVCVFKSIEPFSGDRSEKMLAAELKKVRKKGGSIGMGGIEALLSYVKLTVDWLRNGEVDFFLDPEHAFYLSLEAAHKGVVDLHQKSFLSLRVKESGIVSPPTGRKSSFGWEKRDRRLYLAVEEYLAALAADLTLHEMDRQQQYSRSTGTARQTLMAAQENLQKILKPRWVKFNNPTKGGIPGYFTEHAIEGLFGLYAVLHLAATQVSTYLREEEREEIGIADELYERDFYILGKEFHWAIQSAKETVRDLIANTFVREGNMELWSLSNVIEESKKREKRRGGAGKVVQIDGARVSKTAEG